MPASMTRLRRRISLAIAFLALAGVSVSSVSLSQHFSKSKTAYCDFGEGFNCDIVNRSTYSVVLGIPVALIGILGYLALLALATLYRTKAETPAILLLGSSAGLAFAAYLTYIEAFVLATWCILCLSSLVLIFVIELLASLLLVHTTRVAGKPESAASSPPTPN
jgi:vitamin-K-epoxide reductase (warfarin-sensitive)